MVSVMDIDKLTPGFELDKLIAWQVMGWGNSLENTGLIEHNGLLWKEDPSCCECALPWQPSKRIECAWEVVNRVKQILNRDFAFSLQDYNLINYSCVFDRYSKYTVASSVPLVICLAALKILKRKE